MCCAKRTGRRLISTVEASPFLHANCCLAADTTSWTLVLHSLRTSTLYTLSSASWLNVPTFGNCSVRIFWKVDLRLLCSFTLSCAAYIQTKYAVWVILYKIYLDYSIIIKQCIHIYYLFDNLIYTSQEGDKGYIWKIHKPPVAVTKILW